MFYVANNKQNMVDRLQMNRSESKEQNREWEKMVIMENTGIVSPLEQCDPMLVFDKCIYKSEHTCTTARLSTMFYKMSIIEMALHAHTYLHSIRLTKLLRK